MPKFTDEEIDTLSEIESSLSGIFSQFVDIYENHNEEKTLRNSRYKLLRITTANLHEALGLIRELQKNEPDDGLLKDEDEDEEEEV